MSQPVPAPKGRPPAGDVPGPVVAQRRCPFRQTEPCPWQPSAEQAALIRLVARGLTDEQIARELHLSKHTVSHQVGRLSRLLGLGGPSTDWPATRVRLATWAGANGYADLGEGA